MKKLLVVVVGALIIAFSCMSSSPVAQAADNLDNTAENDNLCCENCVPIENFLTLENEFISFKENVENNYVKKETVDNLLERVDNLEEEQGEQQDELDELGGELGNVKDDVETNEVGIETNENGIRDLTDSQNIIVSDLNDLEDQTENNYGSISETKKRVRNLVIPPWFLLPLMFAFGVLGAFVFDLVKSFTSSNGGV